LQYFLYEVGVNISGAFVLAKNSFKADEIFKNFSFQGR